MSGSSFCYNLFRAPFVYLLDITHNNIKCQTPLHFKGVKCSLKWRALCNENWIVQLSIQHNIVDKRFQEYGCHVSQPLAPESNDRVHTTAVTGW